MQQLQQKLKRIRPVLRAKNAEMEKEAAELYSIREEKSQLVAELSKRREAYLSGVNQLNQHRQSGNFSQLRFLEDGLDFLKGKWTSLFQEVQEIEVIERGQLQLLTLAQQGLKAVENLEEKYLEELGRARAKEEQKIADDKAIEARFQRKFG